LIDLRSDLMTGSTAAVAAAVEEACLRAPAMLPREDPAERALEELLCEELGVEAVLLTPTCTMANQIALRLHLPDGGSLASNHLSHVVTVETRATALSGVARVAIDSENGHPSPTAVSAFLNAFNDTPSRALVWLENTHMLTAGSIMPNGWQRKIARDCQATGAALHLDGSRLWNAAAASHLSMSNLTAGAHTIAISLNKAIGAPLGSVLAGPNNLMEAAIEWRDAMGGAWRPIGPIAAGALAALKADWRGRLERDTELTFRLSDEIRARLGDSAIKPVETNLIFINRPHGDAESYGQALEQLGVGSTFISPKAVRLALHGGVLATAVTAIANAVEGAHEATRRALQDSFVVDRPFGDNEYAPR
jgi:threonine aldolase